VKAFFAGGALPPGLRLKNVAHAFVGLQQKRHTADYDNGFVWSGTNAIAQIDLASGAFADWQAVRGTNEAQDLLLWMFLPKQPRV
jgi:hypothetical protein